MQSLLFVNGPAPLSAEPAREGAHDETRARLGRRKRRHGAAAAPAAAARLPANLMTGGKPEGPAPKMKWWQVLLIVIGVLLFHQAHQEWMTILVYRSRRKPPTKVEDMPVTGRATGPPAEYRAAC